jgi:hypothetical protein
LLILWIRLTHYNYTVRRVMDVYTAQSGDVGLYQEQLSRWTKLELNSGQRQEVNRLAQQIPRIRDRIAAIPSLAEELKGGTIESVLAKSDFELGLEFLLRKSDR